MIWQSRRFIVLTHSSHEEIVSLTLCIAVRRRIVVIVIDILVIVIRRPWNGWQRFIDIEGRLIRNRCLPANKCIMKQPDPERVYQQTNT